VLQGLNVKTVIDFHNSVTKIISKSWDRRARLLETQQRPMSVKRNLHIVYQNLHPQTRLM